VLDGVRGMSWFAVFMGHAGLAPEFAVGQVAMFVFFGLSGFLITAILSAEKADTQRVGLANFFARRALRLVPALLAFLAVWLVVDALFGHDAWMTTVPGAGGEGGPEPFVVALEGVGAGLTYLTNWCGLFGVFTGYVPLGHLWSLAVEEQFYLLWAPMLVLLLRRGRRTAVAGALVLAAASFIDVVWLHHAHATTPWVFYSTDTRSGAFLIGGALGLVWSGQAVVARWWRRLCTPVVLATVGLMAWSAWVFDHSVSVAVYGSAWVVASLAAPLMIMALVDSRAGTTSLLSHPIVTYIGRRSYALYLWHYVWLTWLRGLGLVGVALALVATLACAELSWRVIETPALRLKGRLAAEGPTGVETGSPPGSDVENGELLVPMAG
jgi:peptidoglycan/LPS O-acetylase OafA/YrhL